VREELIFYLSFSIFHFLFLIDRALLEMTNRKWQNGKAFCGELG